mmetsp:Transcript_3892/g.9278  ORF Transcript_3892/g.9278 Transcript_3892/m.9278 type:complete len:309 (+) Transcript_3892:72-998(+)
MMVSAVAFVFLNKEFDVLAFLRHRDFVRFQRFLAFFDVFKDTFILIAGQFRRNFNERMSNSDESPNTENDKNRKDLLEFRFLDVKDQFEDQADRDDKKIKRQKELGKEFFDAESSHLKRNFSHENAKDNDCKRKQNGFNFVHSFPLMVVARGKSGHVVSSIAIGFGEPTIVRSVFGGSFVRATRQTIPLDDPTVRIFRHQKHLGENDDDIETQEGQQSPLDPFLLQKLVDFHPPRVWTVLQDDKVVNGFTRRNSIVDGVSADSYTGSPGTPGFGCWGFGLAFFFSVRDDFDVTAHFDFFNHFDLDCNS